MRFPASVSFSAQFSPPITVIHSDPTSLWHLPPLTKDFASDPHKIKLQIVQVASYKSFQIIHKSEDLWSYGQYAIDGMCQDKWNSNKIKDVTAIWNAGYQKFLYPILNTFNMKRAPSVETTWVSQLAQVWLKMDLSFLKILSHSCRSTEYASSWQTYEHIF